MQICRNVKKINSIQYEREIYPSHININYNNYEMLRISNDLWIKLDAGLIAIENEMKRKMREQYIDEFKPKSIRLIDDIEEFTVTELRCWKNLLNTKFEARYKNGKFYDTQNLGDYYYSKINIINWLWTCDNEQYILVDISLKVKNDLDDYSDEYGAIFLYEDVVLINSAQKLYSTTNTSKQLEERIDSLMHVRDK